MSCQQTCTVSSFGFQESFKKNSFNLSITALLKKFYKYPTRSVNSEALGANRWCGMVWHVAVTQCIKHSDRDEMYSHIQINVQIGSDCGFSHTAASGLQRTVE